MCHLTKLITVPSDLANDFLKVCNGLVNMDMADSYGTSHVNYATSYNRKFYWLNRIVTHWKGLGGAIVNAPPHPFLTPCQYSARGQMHGGLLRYIMHDPDTMSHLVYIHVCSLQSRACSI